ncbi:hypothetical protein IID10_08030, partial [candidate division KSB1 bacterium]|nr:hypothetical protein [candidate division KSB1 bacterium]
VFGAALGVGGADIRIVREDLFLESLAAALSLAVFANPDIKIGSEQTLEMSEIIKKERLKAVAETAVIVNHEINNPLTPILGNIQLIRKEDSLLSDDHIKKLEIIESNVRKISNIVQKYNHISKPEEKNYYGNSNIFEI